MKILNRNYMILLRYMVSTNNIKDFDFIKIARLHTQIFYYSSRLSSNFIFRSGSLEIGINNDKSPEILITIDIE